MKLHNNQIGLLRHLARFQMLAYPDCLEMLDTEQTGDRTALSYAFRPLTKNKYVSKQKDGGVSILAKGRALFPDITPLISAGGGAAERRRVMAVSRMAALMERSGIPCFGERRDGDEPYFIPSACWRNIAHGILSTTRFTGMLMAGVILVAHISQKERNSAAEQQRRAQTEKITEVLDSTWESAASIGDILNNAVWVEKYKSDTSVFDAEFDVLQKREISQFLGEVCTFNTTIRDIAVLYNRKDVAVLSLIHI